jgi:biopolymer transport protein ExbB/TolQ
MTDTFAPAASSYTAGGPSDSGLHRPSVWLAALSGDDQAYYRHLLLLRFAVLNLVALALLAAAWLEGWIAAVLAGDNTRLVVVITLVFAFGLVQCARRIRQTSREIDQIEGPLSDRSPAVRAQLASLANPDGHARALAASALKLRLSSRIGSVRHLANSLVVLGLIGTVIGFIIALSGVDAATAANVEAIGPMVSKLISGMSVALYTTLVGSILNIWLMVNYRLLESGAVALLTAYVDGSGRHAGS